MKLSNLANNVKILNTPFEKMCGLMFKKPLQVDEAYLFVFDKDKKVPIHMLFVFFPIDAIWIDSSHTIVDLKSRILPFTPHVYHKGKASFLLELPSGTIKQHKLRLMDKVEFAEL
jgi:uncharacterized protein